jgi:hypothetical protein
LQLPTTQYEQCETPSGTQIVQAYLQLIFARRDHSGVALDASVVDRFGLPSGTFGKPGEEKKVDLLVERQAYITSGRLLFLPVDPIQ